MSSSESPSPDSTEEVIAGPDRLRLAGSDGTKPRRARAISATRWRERQVSWQNWPVFFLLPVLVAIVQAAAFTSFMHLLFGESFGLTFGREAPWPGGIAIVGLAGFYTTLVLGRYVANTAIAQILAAICWLVVSLAWLATDRDYDVAGLIRDPWSLVSGHGYFVGLLFLAMGVWYQGIRYATDSYLTGADELRAMVQRAWGVMIVGIVLAAVMNNASGDTALATARWAVPICAVASMTLIAAGETESTRAAARRRGATGPKWSRWLRISGLVTGISAILTLIFVVLLGPNALQFLVTLAGQVLRLIGIALGYVAYGIFYLLYQVIRAVYYLLELIFGDMSFERPEQPQQPGGFGGQEPIQPGEPAQPWAHAELIRWAILVVAVILVGLIIFRIRRRATIDADTNAVDESRESVFSSNLLKDQLRGLFRRGQRGPSGPHELDLDRPPASVRETYQYFSVLAERQAVGRLDAETPEDFARRLRAAWPGTGEDLAHLTRAYESVRYGTAPDDDVSTIAPPWSSIYARRKEAATGEEREDRS